MNIQDPLFEGESIRIGAINHETDAEIEAKWTEDPTYMRMLSLGLCACSGSIGPIAADISRSGSVRPLTASVVMARRHCAWY